MDGKIDIFCKNKIIGSVKIHLGFEVPDEMMEMLMTDIGKGITHWQDRILATGKRGCEPL